MPRAEGSSDAARARILRAAAHLCAVHGYEGTSIREIAEAAGVTKPLVHYYFGSKENLFATMLRESVEESHCAMREILARPVSAREKLRALLGWHFARAREVPEIVGFAHAIKNLPDALPIDFDYRSACDQFHAMLVELIREGQRNGEFRAVDPNAVVMMAGATVQAYVNAIFAGDVESAPGAVEDVVLDLIVNGVGTPGTPEIDAAAALPALAPPRRTRSARRGAAAVVFVVLGAASPHAAPAHVPAPAPLPAVAPAPVPAPAPAGWLFDASGTRVGPQRTRGERPAHVAGFQHRGPGLVPGTAPAGAPASPEVAS